MIWSRLKDMLCPACRSPIEWREAEGKYRCTATLRSICEFGIDEEAFTRAITGLYAPKGNLRAAAEEDNLSALNNLGHKIRSEDYSDQL